MKPGARIQTSIEVLEKIKSSDIPMDSTTGDYMRHRRYIGSKDRLDIVERVYAVMRAHARLGWHLEKHGLEDTPRARVIAYVVLVERAWEKRLTDLFDGSPYSPQPLTEKELKFAQDAQGVELNDPAMPEAARVECPSRYEAQLRDYFGKKFVPEMEALLTSAVLDLRVNTFLVSRDKAKASLAADKVETVETPYSPWGLRAQTKAFLSKTKAFNKGFISIQDEGSQLVALTCGAKPGMQVLDYCAGAGGKTLALAAAMERKGRIVAMDTQASRLEKGKERFRKAQVSDIIEVRPLSDERHRKWLRRQKETFDIVLIDVPCSGTGTRLSIMSAPSRVWSRLNPKLV